MKHLEQDRTSNCGQTCVAMISETSIGTVERLMGATKRPKLGSTMTKDLVQALRYFRFYMPCQKLERCNWNTKFPKLGIIKMTFMEKANHGHWVVWQNGWVYDPSQLAPSPLHHYKKYMEHYLKPTSYLHITGRRNV